jgi:hypothetical protein
MKKRVRGFPSVADGSSLAPQLGLAIPEAKPATGRIPAHRRCAVENCSNPRWGSQTRLCYYCLGKRSLLVTDNGLPIDVRSPPPGVLVFPARYRYRRVKRRSGALSSALYCYRTWRQGSRHRESYLGIVRERGGPYEPPRSISTRYG